MKNNIRIRYLQKPILASDPITFKPVERSGAKACLRPRESAHFRSSPFALKLHWATRGTTLIGPSHWLRRGVSGSLNN